MFKSKYAKIILMVLTVVTLVSVMSVTCFAASGDVAGAVESTWDAAKVQIKQVVNNVVFPVIDLVLAVCFFARARPSAAISGTIRNFGATSGL